MLPHKLTLKEGAPVMLLRNMHGAHGQAIGARMLIREIHLGVVEAEIVTRHLQRCNTSNIVLILRINSSPADSAAAPPCQTQTPFPLRLAFARQYTLTRHKARACAWLDCICQFSLSSHGHLYVSNTRVRPTSALQMVVNDGKVRGREGVYMKNVVHSRLLLRCCM